MDSYHKELEMRTRFNTRAETIHHALDQIPFAEFVRQWAHKTGTDLKFTRIDAMLTKIGIL